MSGLLFDIFYIMHDTINLQELCRGQWFYEHHNGPDELRDGCAGDQLCGGGHARQRLLCSDADAAAGAAAEGQGSARK